MKRMELWARHAVAGAALVTVVGLAGHAFAEESAQPTDTIKNPPGLVTVEVTRRPLLGWWRLDGPRAFSILADTSPDEERERTLGLVLDGRGAILASTRPIGTLDEVRATVMLEDRQSFAATFKGHDPESGLTVFKLDEPPADLVAAKCAASDAQGTAAIATSTETMRRAGIRVSTDGEVLALGETRLDVGREIARQLEETGRVTPGDLGATLEEASWLESVLARAVAGSRGVRLRSVARDGPAFEAGLRRGDLIVAFEGQPLSGLEHLERRIEVGGPGRRVQVGVLREGQVKSVSITLAERKER